MTIGQLFVAISVLWGNAGRWRGLRIAAFAVVYTIGECVCLLACLGLWLAAPVPRAATRPALAGPPRARPAGALSAR